MKRWTNPYRAAYTHLSSNGLVTTCKREMNSEWIVVDNGHDSASRLCKKCHWILMSTGATEEHGTMVSSHQEA